MGGCAGLREPWEECVFGIVRVAFGVLDATLFGFWNDQRVGMIERHG